MKTSYKYIAMAIAALLCSCNKEIATEVIESQVQISADITPSILTRVTDDGSAFTDGDAIKVRNTNRENKNLATYTYSESTRKWNTSDELYWEGTSANIFHAWYPTTAAYGSFTIPADQTSGIVEADWMTATASAKKADGTVNLSFNHNLAKVTVTIDSWSNEYSAEEKVANALELNSLSSVMSNYGTVSGDEAAKWVKAYVAQANTSFVAIIAPGTYASGDDIMQVYVNGSSTPLAVKTSSALTLESGKAYRFKLSVGKKQTEIISSVTIGKWDDEKLDNQEVQIESSDNNIERFVIQTEDISEISPLFATVSSTYSGVSDIIGKAIKLGLCYSATNMCPNENDNVVYASSLADGTYNYEIALNPGTLYYYRAIVYFDGSYFYGNTKEFISPTLPIYHQAVDMGLSVKWSPCNLGAETTEMQGDYYAWGEVSPKGDKEKYSQANYVYYDSLGDAYINIGKDISGTKYDAASVNLGGKWRMPTYEEVKELYNNCEWKSATYNGKRGYLVKGSNGQHLFIVTVSCTSTFSSKLGYSQFWTSTLSDNDSYDANDSAYYLNYSYFNVSNTFMAKETLKYLGLPIRPVCN